MFSVLEMCEIARISFTSIKPSKVKGVHSERDFTLYTLAPIRICDLSNDFEDRLEKRCLHLENLVFFILTLALHHNKEQDCRQTYANLSIEHSDFLRFTKIFERFCSRLNNT